MTSPLRSLIDNGTKLWLDSIDPELIRENITLGATGATSNPIIIADLIQSGRFDDKLTEMLESDSEHAGQASADDETVAWNMADYLVSEAEAAFLEIWRRTAGDDGYVSFELEPLLEDPQLGPAHEDRVQQYIDLGIRWSQGNPNRMIKVPATAAGLEALEDLAAAGVTLNVTLMFTMRQHEAACEAIWRGAQRTGNTDTLKSLYSIFISRVDVATAKHMTDLSDEAQGMVGLVNAKRIWQANQQFWTDKPVPRRQEIVFASTGAKLDWQQADYYVRELVGSDIQTNPPHTNAQIEQLGKRYARSIDQLPPQHVLDEIDAKVDMARLEALLMEEGIEKFAQPQKQLLRVIADRRRALTDA